MCITELNIGVVLRQGFVIAKNGDYVNLKYPKSETSWEQYCETGVDGINKYNVDVEEKKIWNFTI